MKVVIPYLELRDETIDACSAWPDLELVDLVADPEYGYARLVQRLWRAGESFAIVEHDVVPHSDTLDRFALCGHDYCAAPYQWTTHVGVALGCTKFSARLLRTFPHAAAIAARIPTAYGEPGHWRQFDVWLQAAVLRDLYGLQPHCHLPAVTHLNEAQQLAPDLVGVPVRTQVEGRVWLEPGLVERIASEVAAAG